MHLTEWTNSYKKIFRDVLNSSINKLILLLVLPCTTYQHLKKTHLTLNSNSH